MSSIFLILVITTQIVNCILIGEKADIYENLSNETVNVWSCFSPKYQRETMADIGTDVFNCAKRNLYLGLANNMEAECVDLGDGVSLINENGNPISPRDIFPLGEEPSTFRGVVDAYAMYLSQRGIRWDLSYLYPGLVMRIGPTLNGAGILEFLMEKRLDYNDRAKLGPGQVMVRRMILPHLLGFRMNLLSLLPIVFGILIYIAKNAFIFSKVTLVLSTILTLKSLFLLQHFRPPATGQHDFVDGGGDHAGILSGIRPRPIGHSLLGQSTDNVLLQMISALPPFRGVNDKYLGDRHETDQRNFAWSWQR